MSEATDKKTNLAIRAVNSDVIGYTSVTAGFLAATALAISLMTGGALKSDVAWGAAGAGVGATIGLGIGMGKKAETLRKLRDGAQPDTAAPGLAP